MTSLTSDIFSSSEYDRLRNLLKHPEEDLQEIIGILENKVETEYNKYRESETMLKKTEQRFRSLIEQTTDAVFCYEYNPPIPINLPIDEQVKRLYDGFLVDCNLVCARSYGAENVESVIGRKLTDLFGTSPNSLDRLFRDLIEGGYSIIDGVGIEELPSGEKRYFLNNGHSVIENNKLVRIWGTFRDITDHTKAEEKIIESEKKLIESEEKFRIIAEQSLMGIGIAQDNQIKYVNKAYADIFGYSVKEMLNWKLQNGLRAIHPDDRKFAYEQLTKKQKGDKDVVINYQYRGFKKSGEIIWVDQYSKTITFNEKPADLIMLIDITKRKVIEKKLFQERDLIFTLLDNHPDFIYFKDRKARFKHISKHFSDYFGRKTKEIIGKTDLELFPEEVAKQTHSEDLQIIKTGIPLINKEETDGETWVLSTKMPWYDKEGNIKGLFGISHDITARKKTEQKLKESEEKYRLLFDNSPVGIGLSTIEGEILDSNDTMIELTGYTAEDLNKAGLNSVYVDPNVRSKILKALQGEGKLHDYDVTLRRKDNSEFFGSVSFDLLELSGKRIIQTSLRDISKNKIAEQELLKLNNLKSELLRRTSHELKTPLVSIKGFSDLLLQVHRDKLGPLVISILNEIKQGCLRLETLIADILKTSELESGTIQLHKSEEDLSFLVRLCINEIKGLSKLRNQTINLELQDNLITQFEKEQVHQVISNLLNNAIKYTPPGGIIEVKSEIKNNHIVISIKDNGIGLTYEEKGRLFKQFGKIERYGQGLDIIPEGSGLGLYISKKIVELHKGEIWVESEGRNIGSTFFFSLPLIARV
jgi:PAS domain S-box-containing protein